MPNRALQCILSIYVPKDLFFPLFHSLFSTHACAYPLPWLPLPLFQMQCQLPRAQVYAPLIYSTNKHAYWDHRGSMASFKVPLCSRG